jgi:hypothetical protein
MKQRNKERDPLISRKGETRFIKTLKMCAIGLQGEAGYFVGRLGQGSDILWGDETQEVYSVRGN